MSNNNTEAPGVGSQMADAIKKVLPDLKETVEAVVPKVTRKPPAPKLYERRDDVPEFFGFTNQRFVFSFSKQGDAITRELPWATEPRTVPVGGGDNKAYAFSLPLVIPGMRSKLCPLNAGLILVSGATEAGKSRFLKALKRVIALERLLAVEPYDEPDEIDSVRSFSSADGALLHAVGRHFIAGERETLFAIDSLRAPLFETSGPAGSKGVIMPFFTQLTRCSQQLAKAGMTVLATVNPMDKDVPFTEAFLDKLVASTSATILIKSRTEKAGVEVFTGEIAIRPDRTKRPFTMTIGREQTRLSPQDYLDEIEFESKQEFADQFLTNAFLNHMDGNI